MAAIYTHSEMKERISGDGIKAANREKEPMDARLSGDDQRACCVNERNK